MTLKITIDTNVLLRGIDGSESERRVLQSLIDFRHEGWIDLGRSPRFDQDKLDDSDIDRVKRDYRIAGLIPIIPAPFRVGTSMLDQDVLLGDEMMLIADQVEALFRVTDPATANRNTLSDIDHLLAHRLFSGDYFLTYERRILNKSEQLRRVAIRVAEPARFVEILNKARAEGVVSSANIHGTLTPYIEQLLR